MAPGPDGRAPIKPRGFRLNLGTIMLGIAALAWLFRELSVADWATRFQFVAMVILTSVLILVLTVASWIRRPRN